MWVNENFIRKRAKQMKTTIPWFGAGLTLVFLLLTVTGIFHHEIWLDEAHHWLLAKDSNSPGELFYNARYEGHPALWNMLLFILSRFTGNPLAMQLLNVLIATAGVFLFCRFAPFKMWMKAGVVF